MTRPAFVLLLVATAACSDLRDVDSGVCGNGIIEAGEDCDSTSDRCVQCSLACPTGTCAEGSVCGADAVCRVPSGKFRLATTRPLTADEIHVTDVDDDHIDDVLAHSLTATTVLYGEPGALLQEERSVLTPTATGQVAFASLDGDGDRDVLVPTSTGVTGITTLVGEPAPHLFADAFAAHFGQPLAVTPIGQLRFLGIVPNPDDTVDVIVVDGTINPDAPALARASLCQLTRSQVEPSRIQIDVAADGGARVLVIPAGADDGARRPCVLAYSADPHRIHDYSPTTQGAMVANRKAIWIPGAAPAAQCPSILAGTPGAASLKLFEGKTTGNSDVPCGFGAPSTVDVTDSSDDTNRLVRAFPIAAGEVGVIMTRGLYAAPTDGLLRRLLASERPLTAAVSTDLDRDGRRDLVATAGGLGSGGLVAVEDVDLFFQRPPVNSVPTFVGVRYDTAAPVQDLLAGDFDGNGYGDFLYLEAVADPVAPTNRLAIAYGTADRPLAGAAIGTFTRVYAMFGLPIVDALDPNGTIDDLALIYEADARTWISVLHGSPQRTLAGFFDPRLSADPGNVAFVGVAPGRYGGTPGAAVADLFAIDQHVSTTGDTDTPARSELRLWRSPDAGGGQFNAEIRCATIPPQDLVVVPERARFLAWPPGSDSAQVVIGVDSAHGIAINPAIATGNRPGCAMTSPGGLGSYLTPWPDSTLQTSGDNGGSLKPGFPLRTALPLDHERLAIATLLEPKLRICTLSATGTPVGDCAVIGQDGDCPDVAIARLHPAQYGTAATPGEPVLACVSGGVHPLGAPDQVLAQAVTPSTDLEVGDLDGDGLDDLVMFDRGAQVLRLYLQCSSKDTSCE